MIYLFALTVAAWSQPNPISLAALQTDRWTREQHAEAEYLWPKLQKKCGDKTECLRTELPKLVDVLNAVEELEYRFGYTGIVGRARAHCRVLIDVVPDLTGYAKCMTDLSVAPQWIVMGTLDYRRLGVSCAGYEALDTGMGSREIAMILGRFGTQLSRAEIGSQSSSSYEWRTRTGSINVIMQNGRLAAKGQFNICR